MKASEIIKLAEGELGYIEKQTNSMLDDKTANAGNQNYTKYSRDLKKAGYYGNKSKQGYNWCCCFVDWLFMQLAGTKTVADQYKPNGTYGASCTWTRKYYASKSMLGNEPKVGDQVFLKPDGSVGHTGLVVAVNDDSIVTIEGNCSNKVMMKKYKKNSKYIDSYGHPSYDPEDIPTFKAGDKVKLKTEYYSNGKHIAKSVRNREYVYVISDNGTVCKISKYASLTYTGTVKSCDIEAYK